MATQTDPLSDLIRTADPGTIRARLDALEAEARALRVILRSLQARDRWRWKPADSEKGGPTNAA